MTELLSATPFLLRSNYEDAMELKDTFYVGNLTVEPRRNRIVVDGDERRVEPLVMRILVRLAQDAGSVVTRDELIESVWSDGFAGDASLSRAVWGLRKALDDDADAPRFIETIPRVGYRLIPHIDRPSRPAKQRPDQATRSDTRTTRESRLWSGYGSGDGVGTDAVPGDGQSDTAPPDLKIASGAMRSPAESLYSLIPDAARTIRRLRLAVAALGLVSVLLTIALIMTLSTGETAYVKQLKMKGEDGRVDTVRVESASPVNLTTSLD